jgi:alkaline phosphatase D
MEINPLTVGPIVGETTTNRVRIWGRGRADIVHDIPRRCFGVVRFRPSGRAAWSQPRYYKMNPNFDLTGIAVIDRLNPDTTYEYETGYFFSDVELLDAPSRYLDWDKASSGSFCTASANDQEPRDLVIGSCRYLLKTFLGSFFDSRGDKTFRSIYQQIDEGQPVHQLIMMGDQIYADDLNAFNPDKTIDQFYKRYRDAFSQKYIRRLMSRVPTYMTLDDHEIEDNWPQKASEQDWKTLFPIAIHAYQGYQLSHSPCIQVRGTRLQGTPNHLWYDYTDGCVDVFVCDSRTERYPENQDAQGQVPTKDRRMLGDEQFRALKRWLANGSGRVKVVVTSVPFFPDSTSNEGQDKWSGYPTQRQQLLRHIESRQINKVVFFSGDVHASFSCELHSPSGLKIISVVSSAFFWPYPHPSARHFKLRGTIDGGSAGQFVLSAASRVISDDCFSRVRITPTQLRVNVYSRKGRRMGREIVHRF